MAKIFGISYATKDEVIVEKMLWNGRFTTIAKVIIEHKRESDMLSSEGLDAILNALNWRHRGIEREVIPDGIYKGFFGIHGDGFAVVLLTDIEGCGSNIFMRRHDNLEYGVFIDAAGGGWRNGQRATAVSTIKHNMYIR